LQQKCAKRIDTRYTPTLQFLVDEGVKNLIVVTQILASEHAKEDVSDANIENDLEEMEGEDNLEVED